MNETGGTLQIVTGDPGSSSAALVCFGVYLVGVFLLAWFASRVLSKRKFVNEYFLGSRNLGMWAFALTFAATSASGGSFVGFPSLIYTHGWVLALWIASYMLVPLVSMGLLAKRLNQIARKAGAVTVPEVMRERFGSRQVGMVATILLTFFMFFYLVAQFKAGANILATLFEDIGPFQTMVAGTAALTDGVFWIGRADADYLLCLVVFAAATIIYTTYGGFRAVVWTDVMQGIVMVFGVLIMLVLVLYQVGGLDKASRDIAQMTPPEVGKAVIKLDAPDDRQITVKKNAWLRFVDEAGQERVLRTGELAVIEVGSLESQPVEVLVPTTPSEIERIEPDPLELSVTVELQGSDSYLHGAGEKGGYLSAPGPARDQELGYLSIGMAFSFFVFWVFGGAGQPSNMVRQMAFKDSKTLRYGIMAVAVYYSIIYFSLVIIFCCARVLLPGMELESDRIMPEMAALLTANAGVPWLAGLLVAAPFAAVMSSVDSFLLMVSSALVRDVYQRNINPDASEKTIKRLTYCVTALVGVAAVLAVLDPPRYLQNLIVFATSGLAGCFLMPVAMAIFWPRMTGAGAIAGMLGGSLMHLTLYLIGYVIEGRFTVFPILGVSPFIWDIGISALAGFVFSKFGAPPKESLVRRFFAK